jgi:hypothetical protein
VVDAGSDDTGCGRWSYVTYGGEGRKMLTCATVYRVCDKKDQGETTAWKQQHNIHYKDETARVRKIDPHKQTLVDLQYFVYKLRNKEHNVAIFIDANQNNRRCYRPQCDAQHFQSEGGLNIDGRIDGSLKK